MTTAFSVNYLRFWEVESFPSVLYHKVEINLTGSALVLDTITEDGSSFKTPVQREFLTVILQIYNSIITVRPLK